MKLTATFPDGTKWTCEADTKIALRVFREEVMKMCRKESEEPRFEADFDVKCKDCKHFAEFTKPFGTKGYVGACMGPNTYAPELIENTECFCEDWEGETQ